MAAPLLPFFQVDVFASDAYRGNPVAVVVALDEDVAAALSTDDMAAFARWTNLSETTFVLPSSAAADYRLRIFTPGTELPFAGHPTLGSCRAWLAHGGRPQTPGVVVQECGAGLVQIRVDAGVHAKTGEGAASSSSSEADREALYRDESATLAFSAPPLLRTGRPDAGDLARVCAAVGLDAQRDVVDAQWIVNGPQWLAVQLRDAQAVLDVNLVDGGIPAGGLVWGVFGAYEPGIGPDGADWEVRTFAPSDGIPEDPVTGSFTAGLAIWFRERNGDERKRTFIVSQGTALGRRGRLRVQEDRQSREGQGGVSTLWVGGEAHVCIVGQVKKPGV